VTSNSEPLEPAVGWSWRPVGLRLRVVVPLATVVFVALLIAVTAYTIGTHRSATHVASGYAYASPVQISASADGWSYDIPLDVQWRDAAGSWHEGSRPTCLRASGNRVPVTFAWVPVHVGQVSWRTVIWVDCR
jgi:hypothetical protein